MVEINALLNGFTSSYFVALLVFENPRAVRVIPPGIKAHTSRDPLALQCKPDLGVFHNGSEVNL